MTISPRTLKILEERFNHSMSQFNNILDEIFNSEHNPHIPSETRRRRDNEQLFDALLKDAIEMDFVLNQICIQRNEKLIEFWQKEDRLNAQIAREKQLLLQQQYEESIALQKKMQMLIQLLNEIHKLQIERDKCYENIAQLVTECFTQLRDSSNPILTVPGLPDDVVFRYNDIIDHILNVLPNKIANKEIDAKDITSEINKLVEESFEASPSYASLNMELRNKVMDEGKRWMNDRMEKNPQVFKLLHKEIDRAIKLDSQIIKDIKELHEFKMEISYGKLKEPKIESKHTPTVKASTSVLKPMRSPAEIVLTMKSNKVALPANEDLRSKRKQASFQGLDDEEPSHQQNDMSRLGRR